MLLSQIYGGHFGHHKLWFQWFTRHQQTKKSPGHWAIFLLFSCVVINYAGDSRYLYVKRLPMPSWVPYGPADAQLGAIWPCRCPAGCHMALPMPSWVPYGPADAQLGAIWPGQCPAGCHMAWPVFILSRQLQAGAVHHIFSSFMFGKLSQITEMA